MKKLVDILRGKPKYMFSKRNWTLFSLANAPIFLLQSISQKSKTFRFEIRYSDFALLGSSRSGRPHVTNDGKLAIPQLVLERISPEKPVELEIKGRNIGLQFLMYRAKLIRIAALAEKGLYQQANHPLLRDIPHHRGCDRENLLTACIDEVSPKSALDIGANMGQSSLTLLRKGVRTTSVEMNHLYFSILKKQVRAYPESTVYRGSIFNLEHYRYDLVLAFSIFHHFLRTPRLLESFRSMLSRLECSAMLFEPHEAGHGFEGAFEDFNETDFCKFICDNSVLRRWNLIGKSSRGRPIFLLTR